MRGVQNDIDDYNSSKAFKCDKCDKDVDTNTQAGRRQGKGGPFEHTASTKTSSVWGPNIEVIQNSDPVPIFPLSSTKTGSLKTKTRLWKQRPDNCACNVVCEVPIDFFLFYNAKNGKIGTGFEFWIDHLHANGSWSRGLIRLITLVVFIGPLL